MPASRPVIVYSVTGDEPPLCSYLSCESVARATTIFSFSALSARLSSDTRLGRTSQGIAYKDAYGKTESGSLRHYTLIFERDGELRSSADIRQLVTQRPYHKNGQNQQRDLQLPDHLQWRPLSDDISKSSPDRSAQLADAERDGTELGGTCDGSEPEPLWHGVNEWMPQQQQLGIDPEMVWPQSGATYIPPMQAAGVRPAAWEYHAGSSEGSQSAQHQGPMHPQYPIIQPSYPTHPPLDASTNHSEQWGVYGTHSTAQTSGLQPGPAPLWAEGARSFGQSTAALEDTADFGGTGRTSATGHPYGHLSYGDQQQPWYDWQAQGGSGYRQ